ncbi:MAG: hypothetical protein H7Y32_07865 [Chloroflexales bacterium]|nr:hypothetical protein [Chloroflexales bacterium]
MNTNETPLPLERRASRKRRLERLAMAIMAIGALMMFQPLVIALYSYSFITFLAGTLLFIVVSHLSD